MSTPSQNFTESLSACTTDMTSAPAYASHAAMHAPLAAYSSIQENMTGAAIIADWPSLSLLSTQRIFSHGAQLQYLQMQSSPSQRLAGSLLRHAPAS